MPDAPNGDMPFQGEQWDADKGAESSEENGDSGILRDGVRCTVTLSDDATEAYALIEGADEEEVELHIILDALVKEHVKVGIDKRAIAQLASKNGARGQSTLVAVGTKPVPGQDAEIAYHFDPNPKPTMEHLPNGKVNYKEAGVLQAVEAGDLIAQKKPATLGESGITVTGVKISARAGTDVVIKKGENTKFRDALQTELVSTISGCVGIGEGNTIKVSPVYIVNGDVDMKTGNIRFDGGVTVKGDVKAGFTVEACGDVEIKGVVEDAHVHCGGTLTIRGGFIGTGEGLIQCCGDVHLLFLENQKLIAGGDIYIAEEIIHGDVTSGGSIYVKFGKGAIIGGEIHARNSVEAKIFGNINYQSTKVYAADNPYLDNMLQQLDEAVLHVDDTKDMIQQGIAKLLAKKYKGDAFTDEMGMHLQTLYDVSYSMDADIKKLNEKHTEVSNKRAKLTKDSYVKIIQKAYPNVTVIIDDARKKIDEEMERVKLVNRDAAICRFADTGEPAQPL